MLDEPKKNAHESGQGTWFISVIKKCVSRWWVLKGMTEVTSLRSRARKRWELFRTLVACVVSIEIDSDRCRLAHKYKFYFSIKKYFWHLKCVCVSIQGTHTHKKKTFLTSIHEKNARHVHIGQVKHWFMVVVFRHRFTQVLRALWMDFVPKWHQSFDTQLHWGCRNNEQPY